MKNPLFLKGRLNRHCFGVHNLGFLWLFPAVALAQVNSGSNGSDGPFAPTTNVVIDMTTHADGIYQFTSVHIPGGVGVSFIPNAKNTPVIWLVQDSCIIEGWVYL